MTTTAIALTRILLANLGNRNLTWDGRNFADLAPEEKAELGGTFKAFTQRVLDDFETHAPRLACTIVNQILTDPEVLKQGGFDQVVLYGSKQPFEDDTRTDQDTYWAAQLMARLLVREGLLRADQVQAHSVPYDISDNDSLMRYYREQLRRYNREYQYPHVSICDAGGSPQQKVALKLMGEFMVDEAQLEVLYVNAKKQTVERVSRIEYRNIIMAEQVRSLVARGQYKAALSLRGIENIPDICSTKKLSDKLVGMGYFLTVGNYEYYHKSLNMMKGRDRDLHPFLPTQPNDLAVKLAKAQFLYRAGQYDGAILGFAVFYETYLSQYLSHHLGYNLLNDYHEESRRLGREAFIRFESIRERFDLNNYSDLKLKLAVALQVASGAALTFLTTLDRYIQGVREHELPFPQAEALNVVRNKIAHKGFIPEDLFMKRELAYFPELIGAAGQLMELPTENMFEQLNETIYRSL